MTDRFRRALHAAAAALWLSAPASAAVLQATDAPPELTRKQLELHPFGGLSGSYDSNIFLHKSADASWISIADLGLRALAASPSDRHKLDLSYDGSRRDYSFDQAPHDAYIHNLQGRYWYDSPWGLIARARDLFLSTIDPASAELTGLRRRWQNTAGLDLGYEPEERALRLRVSGEETRHKYAGGDPSLDRYQQDLGARVGWQVQPKTVVYAGYRRELIHFTDAPDPSRDSKGHLVDLGVEGQLAPHTSGRAQVGFVDRRYDAPAAPGQDRETRNVTALAAVTFVPVDRTRAELKLSRSLEESEYEANQFYISNAVSLAWSHEFMWKLRLGLDGSAAFDKYPLTTAAGVSAVNRRDDVYQAGVDAEYPLKDWLKASASYVYRARFARGLSEQFNYRDDITTVSLNAAF